jgi:hypothetical protein
MEDNYLCSELVSLVTFINDKSKRTMESKVQRENDASEIMPHYSYKFIKHYCGLYYLRSICILGRAHEVLVL